MKGLRVIRTGDITQGVTSHALDFSEWFTHTHTHTHTQTLTHGAYVIPRSIKFTYRLLCVPVSGFVKGFGWYSVFFLQTQSSY